MLNFSKNVDLGPALPMSSWRKIMLGTWSKASDPTTYGTIDLDMGPALVYLEKLKEKSGVKVTLSHIAGKIVAHMVEHSPEINCIMRFGRLYPRKSIDVFFQVASDSDGKDLSGMTIRRANEKSVLAIAQEMHERVHAIRVKGDPRFKPMKKTMGLIPSCLTGYVIHFMSWIMYSLNIWSSLFKIPKDSFGSIMVTNIGSLGLDSAFAPLIPYSRVPMVLALGAARENSGRNRW